MSQNKRFNRILALVAMVATVLLVHFSMFYISEHADHHCQNHAECPVCSVINQCETNLKTVAAGLIIAASALVVFFAKIVQVADYFCESIQTTLVSLKVRLDS